MSSVFYYGMVLLCTLGLASGAGRWMGSIVIWIACMVFAGIVTLFYLVWLISMVLRVEA